MEYQQRQQAREQITAALTVAANWDLPPALLQRQGHRELQRRGDGIAAQRLQRRRDPRAREQFAAEQLATTAQALKEHFILERIAEDRGDRAHEKDYEEEIRADRRPERRVAASRAGAGWKKAA